MSNEKSQRTQNDGDESVSIPRRDALGLIGAAGLGAAFSGSASASTSSSADPETGNQPWYEWDADVDAGGNGLYDLNTLEVDHTYTSAREANVIVWEDDSGTYHADNADGNVASGEDYFGVIQAAVDSLSDDRTMKERVLVTASGTVGPVDELTQIVLPSYTVLDVPATIRVRDEGESLVNVIRGFDEEEIEIPRITIEGNPRFGVLLQNCNNVTIGDAELKFSHLDDLEPYEDYPGTPPSHDPDSSRSEVLADPGYVGAINEGIRISGRSRPEKSEDIAINSVYVENSGHHAVETYETTRVQINEVIARDLGGAGVLLNATSDATINSIIGSNPGGGYPTFRLANENENISVSNVVARGGVRGIAIITDARNVTIGEVNIVGCDWEGIQLTDAKNVTISGGLIRNIDGPGVAIWPHLNEPVNEGITLSNLRIVDDRPADERQQTWAIHEEDNVQNNRFINNDVRSGGTEGLIRVASETTVVRNNLGGGLNSGLVTLESGESPAARIEGIAGHYASTLELRAQPLENPGGPFAYDHYFQWNDGDWDLVFEWRDDPGENFDIEFIVDRNNTGLVDPGEPDEVPVTEWNPPVEQEPGPGTIDDFEDGNLDQYVGTLGNYEVNDESPVAEGTYSLKNPGGNAGMIGSFEGLPRYPEAGDTFAAKVAQTGEGGVAFIGIAFGMQDFDNLYFTRLDWNNDSWQLWKVESGEFDTIASDDLSLTDPGTIYEIVIDWDEDSGITSNLHTTDGEVLASAEAPDEDTFLEGGFGTRRSGMLDDIRILE
ncbi:right-handed parallel beta-helix repeat-containing protein (plasmid) [Natrinema zhouii]|uniref:right-handed parallel beta-helix repeat-containing protein n=1 Tax=Natrinema zhouii TaxID=1710539 RepID=UPI001CFFF6EF|nr:right-handed parallel beta-helix repeat-containing protein [Natrinema zhouii]UHQ98497.1 right-handed parallel beta-helix repeat-containing protein [Natrinema zhouii]